MTTIFSDIVNQQIQTVAQSVSPMPEVDAFTFATSSEFLNRDLFPLQRFLIKHTYNLWEKYPPDAEEAALIKLEEEKWRIKIDLTSNPKANNHVWVLGRRSTKSTTSSIFATYEMYSLICKGNPQAHYGILERHPIFIVHVASRGKQAEAVFTLTSNTLRSIPFFRPYIDFDKDNSSELRVFSPYDLFLNDRIRQQNKLVPRGMQRESTLPGSLNIKSITTSGAGGRGDSVKFLIFSELAHVQRAKSFGSSDSDAVDSENAQTDYALVKAMAPSVLDFGDDGRVIYESSPREKGGEHYRQYCIAGGSQQDLKEGQEIVPANDYKVVQFATWEARPNIRFEDLADEFRSDPVGAEMEYGARFGNPSGQFISDAVVADIFIPNRPLIRTNPGAWRFCISLDPGGRAKKKKADTYSVAWGHSEGTTPDTEMYYIDGFHGFNGTSIEVIPGRFEIQTVDPNDVIKFVIALCEDLGGKNFVDEIVYDQFDSSAPVHSLQSLGYPALETFFTNPYKHEMYGSFLQKLEARRVKTYSIDEGGYLAQLQRELHYLQRSVSGNYVYYHHPSSGPVQNDDFADAAANLVHRLSQRLFPTMQSIADARKRGSHIPPPTRKGPRPISGPGSNVRNLIRNRR